ncbi:MAG: bifunctional oligoribonuclease/PAP phosphatase NrnA [Bacteroidaceae bacterium]|nr:bifunctional oligoribonuclease/PAP phosphatase NrnA [Bacteroidaceae bacterium]
MLVDNLIAAERATELKRLLADKRKVVVTCHHNPDGDALGSALGFAEYLRALGKAPVVLVPDQFPDFFKWLPTIEKVIRFDKSPNLGREQLKNADLICCMDYAEYGRTGDEMGKEIEKSPATKLVIDHHENPTIKTDWLFSFPNLSSTCELAFHLIADMDDEDRLNKNAAQCIYCGMMTDTGGFTFASTRPEIFEIIGRLLKKGIDKDKIYRNVYNNFSVFKLKFWGYVMNEKMHYFPEKGASYYVLTKEEMERYHYIKGDAEGLVNQPLQIKGCRLSISLREDMKMQNKVWVSLRSVDDMDCIAIAEKHFNGGGHFNAAGGQLHCSIQEAEEVAKRVIAELKPK